MRFENIINFFKNFRDRLVHRLINGDFEILPKSSQNGAILPLPSGDIIELIFQIGSKFIAHVLAEKTAQKDGDQTAFIFRNQAIFFFTYIVAILDCCHNGSIG